MISFPQISPPKLLHNCHVPHTRHTPRISDYLLFDHLYVIWWLYFTTLRPPILYKKRNVFTYLLISTPGTCLFKACCTKTFQGVPFSVSLSIHTLSSALAGTSRHSCGAPGHDKWDAYHHYFPCHMLRKQNKPNNSACITSSHLSKSWDHGLQSRSRGGGIYASSSVFVMSCSSAGLAKDRFPVQGFLPYVCKIHISTNYFWTETRRASGRQTKDRDRESRSVIVNPQSARSAAIQKRKMSVAVTAGF